MIAKDFEHTKEIATRFDILTDQESSDLILSRDEQLQLKIILSEKEKYYLL